MRIETVMATEAKFLDYKCIDFYRNSFQNIFVSLKTPINNPEIKLQYHSILHLTSLFCMQNLSEGTDSGPLFDLDERSGSKKKTCKVGPCILLRNFFFVIHEATAMR